MKESLFQNKVIKALRERGAWILNIHGGGDPSRGMQMSGVPDLLVIHRRWKGFLELKIGDRKLSPIQLLTCTAIAERQFSVYILRYNSEFEDMMIEDYCGNKLGPSDYDDLLDNLIEVTK